MLSGGLRKPVRGVLSPMSHLQGKAVKEYKETHYECCKCQQKLNMHDKIAKYNAGVWLDFGMLIDAISILYENDEIAHHECVVITRKT